MINTAGGMTGGDDLSWNFTAGEGARLAVTSQASERIYQSNGGVANINVDLEAKSGSTLYWIPQETILFDRSAGRRNIRVQTFGDAQIMMVESVIFGRKAMGELMSQGSFRDDWSIVCDGKIVHMESTRFDEDIQNLLTQAAGMGSRIAMATVLLVAPATAVDWEIKLEKVRSLCSENAAASHWQIGETGKILARFVAADGYDLRKTLIAVLELLMEKVTLPKSWSA